MSDQPVRVYYDADTDRSRLNGILVDVQQHDDSAIGRDLWGNFQ